MPEYPILKFLGRIPRFGGLLADACSRAGIALQKQDSQENAARYFLWSLALVPGRPQVLNDLGLALVRQKMSATAVPYLRQAIERSPNMLPAWFNLGLSLQETGDAEGAMAAFGKVVELKPDMAEAHFQLGRLLHAAGRLEEGEAALRRALEIEPDKAATWNNLGNVLSDQGRLVETLAAYRRSLAEKPEPYVFSNLLFALNYSAEHTPQQVFDEHLGFRRAFAPGSVPPAPPCAPAEGRRLRIGYVSPDFCLHPVAFFLLPLLEHHDRGRFEIFGYYSHRHQDEYTARIRTLCDHWCETATFDDERMARQVLDDRIDILVDLAGHTADNQLLVFARRAAPIQATWLGYLNTTGLDAMDYRITDAVAAPHGAADALHSEKLLRLPDSQWCYWPPPDSPAVGPLPALSGGGLTFGCLHNPAKIAPPVIALWSQILRALPDAKLIIGAAGLDRMADTVAARFTAQGAARGQIEVIGRLPTTDYLGLHGRIDINLDTFPYSGGTTTCHSLWMGVPVLTLPGASVTSRGGASLLSALGLTEFIAASEQDYIDIALRADRDRDRLASLRAALRERMRESPVMDGARFALNMEAAYQAMWQEKTSGERT